MKSRYLRLEGEISMVPWLASLIAVISSFLCLFLWFRDIRRIKGERRITMESAAGHLVAYRERTRKAQENPEVADVLERNKEIYHQAEVDYNVALHKLWIYLPAVLVGFRWGNGGGAAW